MLHYANVTDMVLGREPEGGMVVQQPKVRCAVGLMMPMCVAPISEGDPWLRSVRNDAKSSRYAV